MVLWEKKCTSVKELGKRLYLDSGTLTTMLKRLESKGYIKRERLLTDERGIEISITSLGEELKLRAADIPLQLGECVKLTPQEVMQLHTLLYKVLRGIHRDDAAEQA